MGSSILPQRFKSKSQTQPFIFCINQDHRSSLPKTNAQNIWWWKYIKIEKKNYRDNWTTNNKNDTAGNIRSVEIVYCSSKWKK